MLPITRSPILRIGLFQTASVVSDRMQLTNVPNWVTYLANQKILTIVKLLHIRLEIIEAG
jgi:hypothetical protein